MNNNTILTSSVESQIIETTREPVVLEAEYEFLIKEANVVQNISTKNGLKKAVDVSFVLTDVSGNEYDYRHRFFHSTSKDSYFIKSLTALYGRNLPKHFNVTELINLTGKLEIEYKKALDSEDIYENIVSIVRDNPNKGTI